MLYMQPSPCTIEIFLISARTLSHSQIALLNSSLLPITDIVCFLSLVFGVPTLTFFSDHKTSRYKISAVMDQDQHGKSYVMKIQLRQPQLISIHYAFQLCTHTPRSKS